MARGSSRQRGDRGIILPWPQSISTTVDIYGHVMKEADLAAAENLARIASPDVGGHPQGHW